MYLRLIFFKIWKTIFFFAKLIILLLIRELHVYGSLVGVEHLFKNINGVQHKGIGKKLVKKAENIAFYNHYLSGVVVISGIGVRGYYEKLGYHLENNYMVKNFNIVINIYYFVILFIAFIIFNNLI